MLLREQTPTFPVEAGENSEGLQVETALFRLEIGKDPFRLSFSNKRTGVSWRFGTKVAETGGIQWINGRNLDGKGTMSLMQVATIRKAGDRWLLQCKVNGSSRLVYLRIRVITPGILRVSANGLALEDRAQTKFQIEGKGPFFGLGSNTSAPTWIA